MSSVQIHKAAGVILRDRKLLVSRSKGKDYFMSPGGKLEPGETALDALARELNEEQGITIDMHDVALLDTFYAIAKGHEAEQKTLKIDVYIIGAYQGEPSPMAEIVENKWIDSQSAHSIKLGSVFAHDVIPRLKAADLID